jgi:hypothetical protein
MSTRNDILDGLKTCLKNITKAKGFSNNVTDVVRKFIFYDQVSTFPYLMVLGSDEDFEDQLGTTTISRMRVRVMGYAKNSKEPEVEQCKLLDDVLTCLDSVTYNTNKKYMRPLGVETDEGMLHVAGEGISVFVLNLELTYRFERSDP